MGEEIYRVGIVGESYHQPTIRECREGERVRFFKESGNPYGEKGQAIVVADVEGRTLGYILKGRLMSAVFRDGRGISGRIDTIGRGEGVNFGVWLAVEIADEPIEARDYPKKPPRSSLKREGDGSGALLGETVLLTGELCFAKRYIADFVANAGGNVAPRASRRVTMMVAPDQYLLSDWHVRTADQIAIAKLIDEGCPIRIVGEGEFLQLCLIRD